VRRSDTHSAHPWQSFICATLSLCQPAQARRVGRPPLVANVDRERRHAGGLSAVSNRPLTVSTLGRGTLHMVTVRLTSVSHQSSHCLCLSASGSVSCSRTYLADLTVDLQRTALPYPSTRCPAVFTQAVLTQRPVSQVIDWPTYVAHKRPGDHTETARRRHHACVCIPAVHSSAPAMARQFARAQRRPWPRGAQ